MNIYLRTALASLGGVVLSFVGFLGSASAAPNPPVITKPVQNAAISTEWFGFTYFEWTPVTDAVDYRFQLDYFDTRVSNWVSYFDYNRGNWTDNATLLYNKEGMWRVRVKALINDGSETAYSNYTYFSYKVSPAPRLTVTTLPTPVAQSYNVGSANVELAKISFAATSSSEPVRIVSFTITDTMSGMGAKYTDIAKLALYDQNNMRVATVNNTDVNARTVTFTLQNQIVLNPYASTVLTLRGDIVARSAQVGVEQHTFNITPADGQVVAAGTQTGHGLMYTLLTASGNGQPVGIDNLIIQGAGTLTLSLVSGVNASPSNDRIVSAGETNVSVFAVKLTAQTEPAKIKKLKLVATGPQLHTGVITNIKIFENAEAVPTLAANQMICANNVCTFTWSAADNLLLTAVNPPQTRTLYVKADIAPGGNVYLGDQFKFSLAAADVDSYGVNSGAKEVVNGNPIVNGNSFVVPFAITVAADAPTPGTSNSQFIGQGTQLGRFKVTNNGNATITLTAFKVSDIGSHSGNNVLYNLYYSDQNSTNYIANKAAASVPMDFPNISVPIDGGAYRYLTVAIANPVVVPQGDFWALGIEKLGDVLFQVKETDLGYDGNGNMNLLDTIGTLWTDGKPQLGTLIKA